MVQKQHDNLLYIFQYSSYIAKSAASLLLDFACLANRFTYQCYCSDLSMPDVKKTKLPINLA